MLGIWLFLKRMPLPISSTFSPEESAAGDMNLEYGRDMVVCLGKKPANHQYFQRESQRCSLYPLPYGRDMVIFKRIPLPTSSTFLAEESAEDDILDLEYDRDMVIF